MTLDEWKVTWLIQNDINKLTGKYGPWWADTEEEASFLADVYYDLTGCTHKPKVMRSSGNQRRFTAIPYENPNRASHNRCGCADNEEWNLWIQWWHGSEAWTRGYV